MHYWGAEFGTLRAVGAFVVSVAFEKGEVQWIEILSQAGSRLQVILPREIRARRINRSGEWLERDRVLEIGTVVGERIRVLPLRV